MIDLYGGVWFRTSFGITGASPPAVDAWAPIKSSVAGSLVQATGANKPSVAQVSGRDTVELETDEFLKSDQAAAVWKWLHDPAGFTLFVVARCTGGANVQKILDTANGNVFQHGISIEFNASSGRFDFFLGNGSGVACWHDGLPGLTVSDWAIYEVTWSQASGVRISKNDGAPVTGSVAGVPSTTNPSGALALGAITAGVAAFLFGNVGELHITPGVRSFADRQAIRNELAKEWGIGLTSTSVIASSDCASDPRLVLPPRLYGLVGDPLELYREQIYFRDGQCSQSASSDLTVHTLFEDRWRIFPAGGDVGAGHTFSVTSAGVTDQATLTVAAQLDGGAPVRSAVFIGDSLTAPGAGTFVQYVKDALGAKLTLIGSVAGGGYPNEGHAGRTWAWFATDPGSPFTDAGGAIDIPAYITARGATPDWAIWNINTNDINSIGNLGILEAQIDIMYGHAEDLIQAWKTAAPATKHLVCMTPRGNALDAPWGGEVAREFYWTKHHRFAERMITDFGLREGELIFHAATNLAIGPTRYTDNVHSDGPGHVELARPMKAALVANW